MIGDCPAVLGTAPSVFLGASQAALEILLAPAVDFWCRFKVSGVLQNKLKHYKI